MKTSYLFDFARTFCRVAVPSLGVLGVVAMIKHPHLGVITDADGHLNLLPYFTIACLTRTLLVLYRATTPT
jgi:hypothetical protein